jgi:hypothetical protein
VHAKAALPDGPSYIYVQHAPENETLHSYGFWSLIVLTHEQGGTFQGFGQGNGAGPTAWAVVSAPIINMVRAAGYGATFVSALSSSIIAFVCYAFVDDTDLVHARPGQEHQGKYLIPEMQEAVDNWEGGLRASGGALVPSKSHWYLVDFKWMNDSWRYCSIEDNPGELSMLDHTATRATFDWVKVSEARKFLGMMIAGNCQWASPTTTEPANPQCTNSPAAAESPSPPDPATELTYTHVSGPIGRKRRRNATQRKKTS